jgi:hydrogenase maturation factor
MMTQHLPVGKLPAELLACLLAKAPVADPRVLVKPGIGLDCAVIDAGPTLFVFKSDPITFATDDIGWYLVQVNFNDIATTGALPRWLMVTLLLPEDQTTAELVEQIMEQIYRACREIGVAVIGGHTEVTYGLERPIAIGMAVGEVDRRSLVTPQGARPGDRVLLTKGVPIEATALLAREFWDRLAPVLSEADLNRARAFLHDPGLGILREAQVAVKAGRVTAMHDPTEGGLIGALWELAEASNRSIYFDPAAVPIPSLALRVCQNFGIDPLAAIASGALLITASAMEASRIRAALETEGILCAEIGRVEAGACSVWRNAGGSREKLPRPARDEIARLYE